MNPYKCPVCSGTGQVPMVGLSFVSTHAVKKCHTCSGTGWETQEKKVNFLKKRSKKQEVKQAPVFDDGCRISLEQAIEIYEGFASSGFNGTFRQALDRTVLDALKEKQERDGLEQLDWLDVLIDYWHTHETGNQLHEFLHMSEETYNTFVKNVSLEFEVVVKRNLGCGYCGDTNNYRDLKEFGYGCCPVCGCPLKGNP